MSQMRRTRGWLGRFGGWGWWGIGLRVVVVVLALVLLRLGGCVERLFYHPVRGTPAAPPGAEEVRFKTADGLTLHGWLLKPAFTRGKPPVVVHCHGNAGNIEHHVGFSEFLTERGIAVFIFDYRGYGASEVGTLNRRNLMTDTRAALDAVLAREDVDRERVGVLGVSLGGAFASELAASRPEVKALALVAPFSGWSDIAAAHVPILGRVLIRPGLDPVEAVTRLGARPLLVLHGSEDTVIPISHGERVVHAAQAAGVKAELWRADGAGHNDIMDEVDPQGALGDFFVRELVTKK